MQELLAKTNDPCLPLERQEYYELKLDDLGFPFQPQLIESLGIVARYRFIVVQAHSAWSRTDRKIMWDDFQHEECATLEQAQMRYQARRSILVAKGFVYSDKDG